MPDPRPLMALSTAYWESQTFLTANRLNLFGLLAEDPLDAATVAERLSLDSTAARLFLNALVGLDLLVRDGEAYANGPAAAAFLVPGTPHYLGNAFRYADGLYAPWADLEKTLASGDPAVPPADYLTDADPARTHAFVMGMHGRALGIGTALVGLLDLTGRQRLLDVGGGPGTYSALLCGRHPELTATVLDLPAVCAVAEGIVAGMGMAERVAFAPGSYLDGLGLPDGQDVVLISGVFHRETPTTCNDLIRRAADALEPGGLLAVADVFTDPGGATPAFAALFGLNMRLTAPDGQVHADADVARWMADAGFGQVDTRPFPPPMPHRLVTGVKP
ncbi:MAG: hypothetical protein KDE22_06810 [Rhodobacterales bacterium]|nr:hypothetical protein [Rhodobacterales bacterium]